MILARVRQLLSRALVEAWRDAWSGADATNTTLVAPIEAMKPLLEVLGIEDGKLPRELLSHTAAGLSAARACASRRPEDCWALARTGADRVRKLLSRDGSKAPWNSPSGRTSPCPVLMKSS
jgi:hypothetical protein